ncbi:gamma-glutamyl-gamma-aminobutyrate hydrolase family protein [Derxia lacustris]|uniref:gamma-glutamyl-gamma-aminobutyrate hydrolase family protein n=1 Tax=Derxia lacustris TaxID=764842 RepID=UPI000A170E17|nr:gamma-glutamyl-gamma-aminobutyrate hydrolase family protein [Derxia lacustris]
MSAPRPFVLLPCCNRELGGHPFFILGRKYAAAVHDVAEALPLPLVSPAARDIERYLSVASGVLLTGSPSNVHPARFGQSVHDAALPLDPERDDATFLLIDRAIALGLPLLAICRGLQEVNVALGGTLQQAVHERAGALDHREPRDRPIDVQYGPAHDVRVALGGRLAAITGREGFEVNSLHGQGVGRLAPGLTVEASAPDGLVEAFSIDAHPGFSLAVQWHPEWRAADNPVSASIFRAFGAACRDWRPPS